VRRHDEVALKVERVLIVHDGAAWSISATGRRVAWPFGLQESRLKKTVRAIRGRPCGSRRRNGGSALPDRSQLNGISAVGVRDGAMETGQIDLNKQQTLRPIPSFVA
jgi:hypothetical protein